MLTELSIRNFAIIDELTVSFEEGLTVLTGETGAGKSIIIDAIELLGGARGSVDFVRYGAKKAELEGLFNVGDAHVVHQLGETYGIDTTDGMMVLNRDITHAGKSICRVNGKMVTLAILKEFGQALIDIHSQHETQSLLNQSYHLQLLDMYNHKHVHDAKENYLAIFNELTRTQSQYKQLNNKEQDLNHKLDLLQFQYKEIANAQLQPDEDTHLLEERKKLANYEKIYYALEEAYDALNGENKAVDWLSQAHKALLDGQDYDDYISDKADELGNYYYATEEMSFDLRSYLDEMQFDSGRLNEVEARLDEINHLKQKYGTNVRDILDYQANISEEIEQIQNKDSFLNQLSEKIDNQKKEAYQQALKLHNIRKDAANALTKAVKQELNGLYMNNAQFKIVFDTVASDDKASNYVKLHQNGFDDVHFEMSTNSGEPLKHLHRIVSGGEMSRIMLALKTIFAKHDGATSIILDEVDSGVSGRVAQAMAEKIQHISSGSQVLCITHLPQVAAMADYHKLIKKQETQDRTTTFITNLTDQEKTEELGRMITGTQMTDTAKDHAKEMLQLAYAFKQKHSS